MKHAINGEISKKASESRDNTLKKQNPQYIYETLTMKIQKRDV